MQVLLFLQLCPARQPVVLHYPLSPPNKQRQAVPLPLYQAALHPLYQAALQPYAHTVSRDRVLMVPAISFRESPPSRLVYWMPRNSMLQSHIQACPLFSVARSDSHWCHKPGISLPHQRSFSTIIESSLCHPPLLRQNPPAHPSNEVYTERSFLIDRKLLLYSETKAKR